MEYGIVKAHHGIVIWVTKSLDEGLSHGINFGEKLVLDVWRLDKHLQVGHRAFLDAFVVFNDECENTIYIQEEQGVLLIYQPLSEGRESPASCGFHLGIWGLELLYQEGHEPFELRLDLFKLWLETADYA